MAMCTGSMGIIIDAVLTLFGHAAGVFIALCAIDFVAL